jgi:hypothetical protein
LGRQRAAIVRTSGHARDLVMMGTGPVEPQAVGIVVDIVVIKLNNDAIFEKIR